MSTVKMVILATIFIVIVAGIAQLLSLRTEVSPADTGNEQPKEEISVPAPPDVKAVSVPKVTSPPMQTSFALTQGDNIVSWDFKGAYTDSPELVAKAQSEIQRLSLELATATSSAMILAVGIANQYELLGDGKKQYEYLGRAIRRNPENGLPWHNLGVLMERLGAYKTARVAYEKATLLQPHLSVYHYAYLAFLIQYMKGDTVGIEKAFAVAEKNIGKKQDLIDLRTEWQKP